MGKVSVGAQSGASGLESLAKISDIYVDRGIPSSSNVGNSPRLLVAAPPAPRRIQPYYIGYNLVYREPSLAEKKKSASLPLVLTGPSAAGGGVQPVRRLTTPQHQHPSAAQQPLPAAPPAANSNPNVGLLATIIAKLKSLAEATSSRIRFSHLLKEPVLLTTTTTSTTTEAPTTSETRDAVDNEVGGDHQQHVLVRVDDLGVTTDEEQTQQLDIKGKLDHIHFLCPFIHLV